MKYKMIVLDLDGTLTNSKKIITKETKEAIMKAQEQGIIVVLASGRPTYGVMPLAEELKLGEYGGFILSYNGANIIDCKTKEVIFGTVLPVESIPFIIQLTKTHKVNILTYEGDSVITDNKENPYAIREAAINQLPLREVEDIANHITFPITKCIMLADGDYLATVEPKVVSALGEHFSVYRSEEFFLEIMPENVDKALSLARLLEHLNLSKEEMIACGDGFNDISMIAFAGLGVAMENGVDAAKEAADFITLSNDSDGVAHVIQKFLWH